MKLYEISREIEEALIQDDAAFDPATLQALKVEFEAKLEGCAAAIKNLRAESDAVNAEIKRLQARKAAIDNNARGLREYVRTYLERVKIRKIHAGIHKFLIQRNSQPSVAVIDQDLIDPQYLNVEIKTDCKAIAANFKKTGEEIPGTKISVGSHLRVN